MLDFFLTIALGALVGFVFYRLKLPGGLMIGALVGVAAFSVITARAYMPYSAKFIAQAVAGAFIGSTVQKRDLIQLPRLIKPFAVLMVSLVIVNFAAGLLINLVSPLSLITSLFAAIPGGMSDVSIIAGDMGADASKVVTMQFVRMVCGIGLFPPLISALDRRLGKKAPAPELESIAPQAEPGGAGASRVAVAITAAAAAVGGLLGYLSGIPAGTLVLSMAAVITLKMLTGRGALPKWVRRFAQVLSGCYVGCSMGLNDVLEMKYLVLPMLILLLAYAVNCLIVGGLLQRLFGYERKMALLAATPAGAADMALISADIGVVSPDLVVLQVLRLIFVIAVFPQACALFARLVG